MKWITNTFPHLRIFGVAEFVDGVFRSDDPVVIAKMADWEGRYGVELTDDDPTPMPVNPFPQYPLEAELLDGSGRVLEGKLPTRLSDAALRAAFGRAAPVLSDFVYQAGTGNLLSYKEDGIAIVLTYNADGTVATGKRGTEPTQTFSYSGGNLAGVA